jgi:blue copper oxidase
MAKQPHDGEQTQLALGTQRRVTRRTFLRTTVATAGVLVAAGAPVALAGKGSGGGTVTRYPLKLPATASPTALTLTAAPASADIGGTTAGVLAYNGQFPGPTIVATNGAHATIELVNGLSQHTITHWHGLIVDTADDGQPQQAVTSGASYSYDFTIAQRASLNWYHPHPHMHTGEQVAKGLAGALIVRDAEEGALNLPGGTYEIPLIIRDASFDSAGNLSFSAKSSGFMGNTPLVNGTRNPYLGVAKGWYRFRVLNGCNARVMRLALSNNAPFTLIGNDGGLLDSAVSITQITLAPAERVDLLVNFSGLNTGSAALLRDLDANWDLLEFRGTGASGASFTLPATLSNITSLSGPTTPTRTFSFDGMTRINGKTYDMTRIDFRVPSGVTERWRFVTNGNGPHPVHVHGASFQVQSRTGGRGTTYPWERGWKDTVLVNDGETVDILIKFERSGQYLIHCHQLGHEDNGMMQNFIVG